MDTLPPAEASLDVRLLLNHPALSFLGKEGATWVAARLERVDCYTGQTVVEQGTVERALFLVLSGTARVVRGGNDAGRLEPGNYFGELGLLAGQARGSSIVASSPLALARLSRERFDELAVAKPKLCLDFTQALLAHIVQPNPLEVPAEASESFGVLLRQRPFSLQSTVTALVEGVPQVARRGTLVGELLASRSHGNQVVAGLLDRKLVSLSTPIASDCTVEPVTAASLDGQRIFRNSQSLLLLEAARAVAPTLRIRIGHSVGMGQRVAVQGLPVAELPGLAACIERRMLELVATNVPLREEWWTVDQARDHFREQGWEDAVALLVTWREPAVPLVSYGSVYALSMGPLVARAGRVDGFEVLVDREGLLLMYGSEAAPRSRRSPSSQLPRELSAASEALAVSEQTSLMTSDQERWLATLGVTSVGALNKTCIEGNVSSLIRVSEGYQEKRISRIADEIQARREQVRVVCIAGPSSAGKTTFIKRLSVQLQVNGLRPVPVSLDDYYCDRERTPRDEAGEYDFEALEALQLDLLGTHVTRLLQGESVRTARYHFPSGKSQPEGGAPIQLREQDILMLEGIHGLNPKLLGSNLVGGLFRIFVCPLAQLPFDDLTRVHASDVRLIRRIVRDRHSRGHNAADTIQRWPSVRAGERRHIFAYQHHADAVFDSSLIYELAVLKVYAERYLLEVPPSHPAYATAFRLLQLIDRFITLYPDHVPPTSILREFIGGSGFEY